MIGGGSGCGLCPWSSSRKVGAYALKDDELETANCGAVLMVGRDDLDEGCSTTDTHVGFIICNSETSCILSDASTDTWAISL